MPRFRLARPASTRWNVAKTLLQTSLFWTLFLVVVPLILVLLERRLSVPQLRLPGRQAVGLCLLVACSALGLWSGVTMAMLGSGTPLPLDAANRLVTTGPYGWVRNPMVLAGLGQGVAIGLVVGSWVVVAYAAAGGVGWQGLVRPIEEENLERQFGAAYESYRQAVPCWLPRWSR